MIDHQARFARPGRESFTLVLAGGGARGFAHVGVLRALETQGSSPSAVVGVSMGAVVAATYALRENWYDTLLDMDTSKFPGPLSRLDATASPVQKVRVLWGHLRAVHDLILEWGRGATASERALDLLEVLTAGKNLEDGRVQIAIGTTDLFTGERVILRSGNAARAVYASSALAGVAAPLERGSALLADGAYVDVAPIDVARGFGCPVVVVDPSQFGTARDITNGWRALVRATEICYRHHAKLRFEEADLVLRPEFGRIIDTFDLDARRECVAAGVRVVRANRGRITQVLRRNQVARQCLPSGRARYQRREETYSPTGNGSAKGRRHET